MTWITRWIEQRARTTSTRSGEMAPSSSRWAPPAVRALAAAGFFLATGLVLSGCEEILIDDQVLEIEGTGTVQGGVYIDWNGNSRPDDPDEPLSGLGVRVVQPLGGAQVASDVTDPDGVFRMQEVPVGTYRMAVDPETLPDSLEVYGIDDEPLVVTQDSVVSGSFWLSYPTYTPGAANSLEPGTRIFTTGLALNPLDPRGDAPIHIQGNGVMAMDYLRAVDVGGAPVTPGDSVRLSGRTAVEAGLPILEDAQAFILQEGLVAPEPLDRTTNAAAGADGGGLNAALVRIQGAEILDTTRVDGHLVATVDDGSGPVDLLLRDFLGFNESAFSPGFARVVEATGLLVAVDEPGEDLRWRLVPRFTADVEVESYPSLTLDVIRGLAAGEGVTAHGIVVNPVDRPVPGTIHIRDRRVGFHIRVRGVSGVSPSPGDSIRVRAETARDVRQPVLDAIRFTVLEPDVEPNLVEVDVETNTAFTAAGGGLDAALVRVQSAVVTETSTVDGHFVATIDDGTGAVEMMVRSTVGFDTSTLTPGTALEEAVGVLVPYFFDGAFPRWRILPRSPGDIQVAP